MSRDVFERYELPARWRWEKLGDICDIADRDHRTPTYEEDGVPLISPRDFTEDGIDLTSLKRVARYELDAFRKKCKPAKGDILYSRIGTVGEARLVDFDLEFVALHSIAMVKPKTPGLLSKYVLYLLKTPSVRNQAKHNIKSVGTPDLGLQRIRDFSVPVAPIDQQSSIVAEIEKQFSHLDKAVAGLQRVKANFKRYRAAVLKAAVEGHLVQTEADFARRDGRDYETGAQLLQRILDTRRKQWQGKGKYKEPAAPDTTDLPELPEGWVWATTEQLGYVQLGRQRSPKNRSKNFPVQYLRAANITESGLDLSDLLDMEFSLVEQDRYRLKGGDLVLSEASGSPSQVGKPAIWKDQLPLCCFQNTVLRLRPTLLETSQYVLVVFQSCYANGVFAKVAGGVGINHLSSEKFSRMPVALPPRAEQHRIVAEVDRLLSIAREAEAEVETNLKRAQALCQSILSKAFASGPVRESTEAI